ncbi:MAG: dimethylmenaquinone methyltransferase [Acidobacteria bacterium]|nr:dimethylmenaquinone methyltransferase [Acidobacteriota bacterium]
MFRTAICTVFTALLVVPCAWGQLVTLTRDQLIQYTAQNPYERFPDGRPKVPDEILERVKTMSAEEALGLARRGFANQYEDGWQILRPGKKLVGRAFTLQMMPSRPDIMDPIAAARKAAGQGRLTHQTAIDMLQPGDVFVVDAGGMAAFGGIVGDNLAYYIWKTTKAGFVIDGAIRDLEGVANFDMGGYFRHAVPPAINNLMVTGINVPVRIGKTTVMPGDVVLGDREGVYFIPPHLIKETVDTARVTQIHDEWTKKKFDEGKYKSSEIYGSPSDPALKQEYQEYLKKRLAESVSK